MDFFAPIFNFIIDSSKKLSYRAATVLLSFSILLLLDNIFGFSYYHNLDKKVELVNNINRALKDTSNSISDKRILIGLKEEIINHSSIKDNIYSFLSAKNWHLYINFSDVSHIFLFITACAFPLFMMCGALIVGVPLFFKKKIFLLDDDNQTVFLKIAGVEFLGYILCVFQAKILLMIPIIYNIIYLNYIVNLGANFILLILFVEFVVKNKPNSLFKTWPVKPK
jgi:hypothetical protein